MQRREFIALLGGAATVWSLPARAQQAERMRRIGILWPYTQGDSDSQSRIASLRQALQDLGWTEGRNVRFEYRWGASAEDRDRIRRYAMELVALTPDVIVAGSGGIAMEDEPHHTDCVPNGFADAPNGGLIVTPAALATTHRDVIIKIAGEPF